MTNSVASEGHDWHLFDEERGYEVAREGGEWHVRKVDNPEHVTVLNDEEFEQFRAEGDNPAGLE